MVGIIRPDFSSDVLPDYRPTYVVYHIQSYIYFLFAFLNPCLLRCMFFTLVVLLSTTSQVYNSSFQEMNYSQYLNVIILEIPNSFLIHLQKWKSINMV